MYNISEDFRSKMMEPTQQTTFRGTIGGLSFYPKNIVSGSLKITNQCSGSTSIEIGQVYIGQLNATFKDIELSRGSYRGKEIFLEEGLLLDNNEYEYVPLGYFVIDEADHSAEGVSVVAYDSMSKFDKHIYLDTSSGRLYDFIAFACEKCDVELGMTEEEIDNLPNGSDVLGIYEENDLETYRDLISWCAQTSGTNALITRDNKLIFKGYGSASQQTFSIFQRLSGASFSDFSSYYTGMSIVDLQTGMTNYYTLEEVEDDGLTYNLGSNPLLQYGLDATKEEQRLNVLRELVKINYVPCRVKLHCPPVFDLMDVLTFTGGYAGSQIQMCITKFDWTYGGSYEIRCVGTNPALASARSKLDKNITGLLSNVNANEINVYGYTNLVALSGQSGEDILCVDINFATANSEAKIDIWIEICVNTSFSTLNPERTETVLNTNEEEVSVRKAGADRTIIAYITHSLDEEDFDYHPEETWNIDGKHILSLHYYLGSLEKDHRYHWRTMLRLTGGDARIDVENVNAYLSGLGLVGESASWDGTINLYDEVDLLDVGNALTINGIRDSIEFDLQGVPETALSDRVTKISLLSLFSLKGVSDQVTFREVVKQFILNRTEGNASYDQYYVTFDIDNAFVLRTSYSISSVYQSIDRGNLCVLDIGTSGLESITSLEVTG